MMVAASELLTSDYLICLELQGAERFSYRASKLSSSTLIRARGEYLESIINSVLEKCPCMKQTAPQIIHQSNSALYLRVAAGNELDSEIESALSRLNRELLQEHGGQLYLVFASRKITEAASLSELALSLKQEIIGKSLEPFKSMLDELFAIEESNDFECDFCGSRRSAHDSFLRKSMSFRICKLCSRLVAAKQISFEPEQSEALMHLSFEPFKHKYSFKAGLRPALLATKLLANAGEGLCTIDCNDENLIVSGKMNQLFDLSFKLSGELLERLPEFSFYGALLRISCRLPFSFQLRELMQLSSKSARACLQGFTVCFGGKYSLPGGTFPMDAWRQNIKPMMEKIRHYDNKALLGYGFWDYLFQFARGGSTALYPLMYRIARREEAHGVLRNDKNWQSLKKDLLVSLSAPAESEKRIELCTALAWALVSKQHFHPKERAQEELVIERV